MTETALRHAKRPATPLAGPYGHPFHPLVVTLPIGAWVTAVVFDVAAFFASDEEIFATGAQWLYAIGIIGAVVAAVLGLLDYTRLTARTPAKRIATIHMILNITALLVFIAAWAVHLGNDDATVAGLVLGIIGVAGLGASGFLGGELIYRHGVRVADEKDQAPGHEPAR